MFEYLVPFENVVISWLILAMLAIAYGFFVRSFLRRRNITPSPYQAIALIAFGVYALAVIYLVFLPYQIYMESRLQNAISAINFIPILTIDPKGFLLNILMTVPLGVFAWSLFGIKNMRSVIYLCLCVSGSIEVLQFLNGALIGNWRQADINDIFANCLGGILGFVAVRNLAKASTFRAIATKISLQ